MGIHRQALRLWQQRHVPVSAKPAGSVANAWCALELRRQSRDGWRLSSALWQYGQRWHAGRRRLWLRPAQPSAL